MKIILILLAILLNLFEIIDSKEYRVLLEDKILQYIDRSVDLCTDYISFENFFLEQVDDDNVQIGGYLESVKSMDRSLPVLVNIRTQKYERATWNNAAYQIILPNACIETENPLRPWYNISKLWNSNVCPMHIGDKLVVESQTLNIIYDVPSAMGIVPWRAYILISQGLPGFEKIKYGFGIQFQFLEV